MLGLCFALMTGTQSSTDHVALLTLEDLMQQVDSYIRRYNRHRIKVLIPPNQGIAAK
ncbi:hypothetical protein RGCCGE502_33181 (plasmid) [Rhizobium grahamii CCGE 502]|uniref:Uncharacterized protein n=1 Tax=Rhizobium grahamii CCGE 502 TaxID=990285 RepID=S3I1S8_9HYPH|nr:hypothetical protein RGCCGE502_33181 [Rhizobium grahamii CCGE 502]